MPSLVDSFSGRYFRQTIEDYCSGLKWAIREIDNRHAVLTFEMESGQEQVLYILRYESTLEFSVPSAVGFDTADEVPGHLSTLLLRHSAEKKIGFWCLEEIGEKLVFSCMHNAELQLIDVDYFAAVARALTSRCEAFEQAVRELFADA